MPSVKQRALAGEIVVVEKAGNIPCAACGSGDFITQEMGGGELQTEVAH